MHTSNHQYNQGINISESFLMPIISVEIKQYEIYSLKYVLSAQCGVVNYNWLCCMSDLYSLLVLHSKIHTY